MEILFYAELARPFTGKTIYEEGCGGSESALIYVSRELAKLGHKVYVFSKCGDNAGVYDGVQYYDIHEAEKFIKDQKPIDIYFAFRDIRTCALNFNAKAKILWTHDDYHTAWRNDKYLSLCQTLIKNTVKKCFVVSKWHAEIFKNYFGVPAEMIFQTRNGVYLPYFDVEGVKKERFKLIHTSVPDRALDVLLDIFPKIREKVQEAELYIYSSFDIWNFSKEDVLKITEGIYDPEKLKQPGVHFMKTVKQNELAKELLSSRLMLYPNHSALKTAVLSETSCIAALEAQAAGTPVVTSNRGALPETVLDGQTGVIIDGNSYSPEYQSKFVDETVRLLLDDKYWEKLSKNARERIYRDYSWSTIAKEWEQEFKLLI